MTSNQVSAKSKLPASKTSRFGVAVPGSRSALLLRRMARQVIVPCGLLLVMGIGLLDYETECQLSLALFYLLPIAAGVWWGGFAHGVLLALAGVLAWHLAEFA